MTVAGCHGLFALADKKQAYNKGRGNAPPLVVWDCAEGLIIRQKTG